MKGRGFTQAAVARVSGLSPITVAKVVKGDPKVTLQTIARLGIALGVRPKVALRGLER